MNSRNQAGTIMAALVWLLMLYSVATVTLPTVTEGIDLILGMIYCTLFCMALASHAKTSFTDPGSVPGSAVPQESQKRDSASHSMCEQCQNFKPPMSHHCRICPTENPTMEYHLNKSTNNLPTPIYPQKIQVPLSEEKTVTTTFV